MEIIAINHGFVFSRTCACANPGKIYVKGKVELNIRNSGATFVLTRIGNHKTQGNASDLERILTIYNL